MIRGMHAMFYSDEADALRTFIRDELLFPQIGSSMKMRWALVFAMIFASANASASSEVVCSYAPSQSNLVAGIAGVAGAPAAASAVATATGLAVSAVAHSSGALILTGTSGYIAGTIGTTAAGVAAAPVIIAVGLVVAGTAVTVELVCAGRNHPEQVAKVHQAAREFSLRFTESMQRVKVAASSLRASVVPATGRAAVAAKKMASDVWQYAYQHGAAVSKSFGR